MSCFRNVPNVRTSKHAFLNGSCFTVRGTHHMCEEAHFPSVRNMLKRHTTNVNNSVFCNSFPSANSNSLCFEMGFGADLPKHLFCFWFLAQQCNKYRLWEEGGPLGTGGPPPLTLFPPTPHTDTHQYTHAHRPLLLGTPPLSLRFFLEDS